MATLTAVKFPTAVGGGRGPARSWSACSEKRRSGSTTARSSRGWTGAKKPKTRQLNHLAGSGALGGGFWGLLFGLIFFVPILGLLVGAAMGAATASLADVGIDDDFIKEVREKVTPGTSALFALTSDGVPDKVAEAFRGVDGELLHTNLSSEQEAQLREVFSEAHAV